MRIDAQIKAARPDASVLLSASAGSGKTHVLVRRMIHLMAAGVHPSGIAAATFTEKAAAQMKDRLYGVLADAAHDGKSVEDLLELEPSDIPYPLTATPEKILSELAARPDELRIGTIHALCLRILRQFPLEAGLTPGFRVMDESELPARRMSAVDACMDSITGTGLEDEFRTLMDAGFTVGRLRDTLADMLGKRSHFGKLAIDSGGFARMADKAEKTAEPDGAQDMLKAVRAGASEIASLLKDNNIELPGYLRALETLAFVREVTSFPAAFDMIRGFIYTKEMGFRSKPPLTKTAAKAAGKTRADELKQEHDTLFMSFRDDVDALAKICDAQNAARALAAFFRIFESAEDRYTLANRRDGVADFDDLELYAYRLLTGPYSVNVLYRLESRALHYLVDEFQDTGEIQWGIIRKLTDEVFAGQGAEGAQAPTLFAVGDVKQSIYRFRMANHTLMDRLRSDMENLVEEGRREFPELTYNFRSAPEIIDVVDETFGAAFEGYPGTRVFRESASGSVMLSVVDRDEEPDALADAVRGALGLPVWDANTGTFRPAEFGDMAVLLRSRGRQLDYEDALRSRGVPFKVVGGVGFFFQPEVLAVTGILNYLDDLADTLSLAGALKSPLFGLSDGELEPLFVSEDPLAALSEISPDAHRLVTGWNSRAGITAVGRLVEDVIEESAALFSFGLSSGPAAMLNIEKLAGLAREFDRRGGVGLSGFTQWVREYRDSSELATADVELPDTDRFVSIMTVHAAKGLEFPVVFIPNMDRKPRPDTSSLITSMERAGDTAIWTHALSGDNPDFARLKKDERAENLEEEKRLLYVAMTRSMDHLFMFTGGRPGRDGGWIPNADSWSGTLTTAAPKTLFGTAPDMTIMPATYTYPIGPPERIPQSIPDEATASVSDDGAVPERLKGLPVPDGIRFVTPSGLVQAHPEDSETPAAYPAALRGSVIHRAIELYGRTGELSIGAAAKGIPGFGALDKRLRDALLADVDRTLRTLTEDETIGDILSPGEGKYFELPLLLKRGGDIVHGSADLVVAAGGAASVYDFKSGLTDVSVEEVIKAYGKQVGAYAEAVSGAFGVRNVTGRIILTDTCRVIDIQ